MNAWVPGSDCLLSDPCPDPALRLAWNWAGCLVRRRSWLPHVKARKKQAKDPTRQNNQQNAKPTNSKKFPKQVQIGEQPGSPGPASAVTRNHGLWTPGPARQIVFSRDAATHLCSVKLNFPLKRTARIWGLPSTQWRPTMLKESSRLYLSLLIVGEQYVEKVSR